MQASLNLRIGALFELLAVSAFGVYLPQLLLKRQLNSKNLYQNLVEDRDALSIKDSLLFRGMKVFSGGLVVSIAFCHLLADATDDLADPAVVDATNGFPC